MHMVMYNQIGELILADKVGQANKTFWTKTECKQNNRIIIFQLASTIHT